MQSAVSFMRALREDARSNAALADELIQIAIDLEAAGLHPQAAAVREIIRHHRAEAVKYTALLGGLEAEYGSADHFD